MKLYWLDLETTGLDARTCSILEVAVKEAEFLEPFISRTIYKSVIGISSTVGLDPFIINMHTKNGLLDECLASNKTLGQVENEMLELIPFVENKEDRPTLAGSSIYFDYDFIKVHMPRLVKRLSHRLYDVSAIKLFCQSLGMPKFQKMEAHRALDDIEESIAHAKVCTEWLKNNLK